MKDYRHQMMTRRSALRRIATLAGAAALPAVGLPPLARAAEYGTTPKAAVRYQDHPKGNEYCANCINFIAGNNAGAMGHCRVVAGEISSKGWCLAYAEG